MCGWRGIKFGKTVFVALEKESFPNDYLPRHEIKPKALTLSARRYN